MKKREKEEGEVNVIRREEDGRMKGELMDGVGFVRGIENEGNDVKGRRVYIEGEGGEDQEIEFEIEEEGVVRLKVVKS